MPRQPKQKNVYFGSGGQVKENLVVTGVSKKITELSLKTFSWGGEKYIVGRHKWMCRGLEVWTHLVGLGKDRPFSR